VIRVTGDLPHPVFARAFALLMRAGAGMLEQYRRELVEGLAGRVVEVGAGSGASFPYYPPGVNEVVAVEPEPYLRRLAEQAAGAAPVPVRVVPGLAEELPLADGSFDAAVVSLVLCSVGDPDRALAEIRRVLRPGGELRFWEHVIAPDGRRLASLQRALDRVWPRLAGGCHAGRDTVAAIERAGFAIERCRRFDIGRSPTAPHVLGAAR
jgi:ubiquinone/menaquinone biosynthesis C-methylase UbiE